MSRGYFGIGIVAGKTPENIGGLWRSAHAFGAAFIFTVGHRYPDRFQPTDTTRAARHIPLLEYGDPSDLIARLPRDAKLVGVECDDGNGYAPAPLPEFGHPERAVYLLGAEDRGIPQDVLGRCDQLVHIPGRYCLNVATAGSIVLYDRMAKVAA